MTNSQAVQTILLAIMLLLPSIPLLGAAPATKSSATKPSLYAVDLDQNVTLRVGDSVFLNGTDFAVKFLEYTGVKCASKQNCGVGYADPLRPVFIVTEGKRFCDTKRYEPNCLADLTYRISFTPPEDRTPIQIRIVRNEKTGKPKSP